MAFFSCELKEDFLPNFNKDNVERSLLFLGEVISIISSLSIVPLPIAKNNSSIDEVIATNRHCVGPEEKNTCIARIFTISALAERRTFIEGWAYTTCPVSEALNNSYWNQPLLALNQKVVVESDKTSAVELSKYGVQWLLIDLRRPHSNDYYNIATKEFSAGEVEVWKLTEKANTKVKPVLSGCKPL